MADATLTLNLTSSASFVPFAGISAGCHAISRFRPAIPTARWDIPLPTALRPFWKGSDLRASSLDETYHDQINRNKPLGNIAIILKMTIFASINESWELMNIHYTSLSLDCIFSKGNISGGVFYWYTISCKHSIKQGQFYRRPDSISGIWLFVVIAGYRT